MEIDGREINRFKLSSVLISFVRRELEYHNADLIIWVLAPCRLV